MGPIADDPLQRMYRMRADILEQIGRDTPERLQAETLGLLAQELLTMAAHRNGLAYALGWLEVIAANLRHDIQAAARAMMRLHPDP